jgi:hypothetical protein
MTAPLCNDPGYVNTFPCKTSSASMTYSPATIQNTFSANQPVLPDLLTLNIPGGAQLSLNAAFDIRQRADFGRNGVPIIPIKVPTKDIAALEFQTDGSENNGNTASAGLIAYRIELATDSVLKPRWYWALVGLYGSTSSWQPRLRYVVAASGFSLNSDLDWSPVAAQLTGIRIAIRMERVPGAASGWRILNRRVLVPVNTNVWGLVASSGQNPVGSNGILLDSLTGLTQAMYDSGSVLFGLMGEGVTTTASSLKVGFDYISITDTIGPTVLFSSVCSIAGPVTINVRGSEVCGAGGFCNFLVANNSVMNNAGYSVTVASVDTTNPTLVSPAQPSAQSLVTPRADKPPITADPMLYLDSRSLRPGTNVARWADYMGEQAFSTPAVLSCATPPCSRPFTGSAISRIAGGFHPVTYVASSAALQNSNVSTNNLLDFFDSATSKTFFFAFESTSNLAASTVFSKGGSGYTGVFTSGWAMTASEGAASSWSSGFRINNAAAVTTMGAQSFGYTTPSPVGADPNPFLNLPTLVTVRATFSANTYSLRMSLGVDGVGNIEDGVSDGYYANTAAYPSNTIVTTGTVGTTTTLPALIGAAANSATTATGRFQGNIYGIVAYNSALSDADTITVQRFLSDRYYLSCPAISAPLGGTVAQGTRGTPVGAFTFTGISTSARRICAGVPGSSCVATCAAGQRALYGGLNNVCNRGRWTSRAFVCGASCLATTIPSTATGCSKLLDSNSFTGNGTSWMDRYEAIPRLPTALEASVWSADTAAGVLAANVPVVPKSACMRPAEPSFLLPNSPAWQGNLAPTVGYTITLNVRLQDSDSEAGMTFRFADINNHWRFTLVAGGIPTLLRVNGGFVTDYAASIRARPTIVAGAVYSLSVTHKGFAVSATVNGVVVYAISETAGDRTGLTGPTARTGRAFFNNYTYTSECDGGGFNVCANLVSGQSCSVSCRTGYFALRGTSTCTQAGGWDRILSCAPLPPIAANVALSASERAPVDSLVGIIVGRPQVAGTVEISYDLNVTGNDNFQGAATDIFRIGACTGEIRVNKANVLDFNIKRTFALQVRVIADSLTETATIITATITILNVNDPPVITVPVGQNRLSRTISENSAVTTPVGTALAYVDPDSDVCTWEIVAGNTDGFFSINAATGLISVTRSVPPINFEQNTPAAGVPKYSLLVRVFDPVNKDPFGGPLENRIFVDVFVTDVNDAPTAPALQPLSVETEMVKVGGYIGTPLVVADEDAGDTATWDFATVSNYATRTYRNSVSGQQTVQTGVTTIYFVSNGQLAFNAGPPATYTVDNYPPFVIDNLKVFEYYDVSVKVTDRSGLSAFSTARVYIRCGVPDVPDPSIRDIRYMPIGVATGMPTRGNGILYLVGRNFFAVQNVTGTPNVNVTLTLTGDRNVTQTLRGPNNEAQCQVMDDETVACKTQAGFGGPYSVSAKWRIAQVPIDSDKPIVAYYAVPNITSILGDLSPASANPLTATSPGALLTSGFQDLVIRGTDLLSLSANPVVISYGPYTATPVNEAFYPSWAGVEDVIKVRTVPGIGNNFDLTATVGGIASAALVSRISYANPTVTSITLASGRTVLSSVGGDTLRVTGNNLGSSLDVPTLTYGNSSLDPLSNRTVPYSFVLDGSACRKITPATAHTYMECTTKAGAGANHPVTLSWSPAYAITADTGQFLTYEAPVITRVSGAGTRNADTAGGQAIVISGTGFGPTQLAPQIFVPLRVTYGPTGTEFTAASCLVTVAGTQMECKTGPGTGTNHSWQVFVASQRSPLFWAGSGYGSPVILSFDRIAADAAAMLTTSDFDTSGGEFVLISGRNFGAVVDDSKFSAVYMANVRDRSTAAGVQIGDAQGNLYYTLPAGSCTTVTPFSRIQCRLVAGAGQSATWSITVDGLVSAEAVTSYGDPTITAIQTTTGQSVTAASTDGGQVIVILGTNFGPAINCDNVTLKCAGYVQSLRFGRSGSEYAVASYHVVSHTRIEAVLPPGFGSSLRVAITVADQSSALSADTFSYAGPAIASVTPSSAATDAAVLVTVVGSDFALLDPAADVAIIFGNAADGTQVELPVATRCPSVQNPTGPCPGVSAGAHSVTFRLPRSLGGNRAVQVRVFRRGDAGGASLVSPATRFDYTLPSLETIVVTVAQASSQEFNFWVFQKFGVINPSSLYQVTIYGSSFGPSAANATDSVGRVVLAEAAGNTWDSTLFPVWTWSDKKIITITRQNIGNLRVAWDGKTPAGADEQYSSQAVAFSDVSPEIGSIVGTNTFPTTGGVVAFNARNLVSLANTLTVSIGGRRADLVTDSTGTTIVTPGNAKTQLVNNLAYYTPVGQPIGPDTVWTLYAIVPPGQGTDQPLVITRDNANSSLSDITVSYAAPTITSLETFDDATSQWVNVPRTGATFILTIPTERSRLRVTGLNYGLCPSAVFSAGPVISLGAAAALVPGVPDLCGLNVEPVGDQTRSHTEITFRSPRGEGTGLPIYPVDGWTMNIDVAGQRTESVRVRYLPPTVTTVTQGGSTAGGDNITIVGKNFGLNPPTVEIGVVGELAACTGVLVLSPTTLVCSLPELSGKDLSVVVTVADQSQSLDTAFSYSKPVVTNVTVVRALANGNTTNATYSSSQVVRSSSAGGHIVTVVGTNFGASDYTRHCLFVAWRGRDPANVFGCDGQYSWLGEGDVPSYAVLEWSHTRIVFYMPPGLGAKDIVPFVRGQAPVRPPVLHYDTPAITAELSPAGADTDGGARITIRGASFGIPSAPKRQGLLNYFSQPVPLPANLDAFLAAAQPPTAFVRVDFFKSCISDDVDVSENIPTAVALCTRGVVSRTHDAIVVAAPSGIGANRSVFVTVYDVEPNAVNPAQIEPVTFRSDRARFDYNPPVVTSYIPRPVKFGDDASPTVTFSGKNFGSPPPPTAPAEQQWTLAELAVSATIGVHDCTTIERRAVGGSGVQVLDCVLAADYAVGYYNLTYTVAGQTGRTPADAYAALFVACDSAYFGKNGETCLPCMTGAVCAGFDESRIVPGTQSEIDGGSHTYPRPIAGWYNLNSSDAYTTALGFTDGMGSICPDSFRVPGRDVCVAPCEPVEACLADNYCASGYTSKPPMWRCSSCDKGFYKRGTECVRCPDSPYALVIGFTLLVVFGGALAYWLNKRNVNLAFISIGVDFFQVISILLLSKIGWPESVKQLLHILSAFNLNLDIVAPECLVPDVSFRTRWAFVMLLPVSLSALFAVIHAINGVYASVVKGQSLKKAFEDPSSFISSVLLLMYLLYIYLTRQVLDVFNCAPTEPPSYGKDGQIIKYMVAVFEECGVAGGTQVTLLPAATAALIIYVAGYPAFIAWLMYKNREVVMEDQLLRAKGVGDDRLTNPNCLPFRKMWSRVYYQFKPETFYWGFIILNRKLWLAVTFVIFNRNAAFQLAASLMVMILSYALHVKYLPYMSPGDMEDIIKQHEALAATSPLHAKLRGRIAAIEARGRRRGHKNLLAAGVKIDAAALLGLLSGVLFNYNTVEAVMLFGAVIVNLMGVMYAAQARGGSAYSEARDAVTSVVLAAIIICILYFVMVIVVEITTLAQDAAVRRRAVVAAQRRKKSSSDDVAESDNRVRRAAATSNVAVGNVSATMNPMFASANKEGVVTTTLLTTADIEGIDEPTTEMWHVFQATYTAVSKKVDDLNARLAQLKVQEQQAALDDEDEAAAASAAAGSPAGTISPRAGASKVRQQFGPTTAAASEKGKARSSRTLGGGSPAFGGSASPGLSGARGGAMSLASQRKNSTRKAAVDS